MQFDFKNLTESKKLTLATVGNLWQKSYKAILVILLVVAIASGAYIWRKSLSGGQWSEEKKQEYLNAQNKGVIFKEGDFKKATEDVEMRKKKADGEQESIKDIFKAY
ncbi:MAG: hypothetical protein ACD_67C00237G0001 [uncultured bacterium]|nr:MAG: hypothetical protein ACD_67C00237G0001 [uncultured bacterium]